MIFLRCLVRGFGSLTQVRVGFEPGLNLIFAPNEGGKSTLQRFVTAMLYGQWRPDLKSQRRLESWVEQYRPWRVPEYGGILWCRLQDGTEIEIHRGFGKDAGLAELHNSTGEEISDSYERQRNGEVLFAQRHLGLPKELFESVAVVRENRIAELNGHASLRDRISNLAQSGDEELSVRSCLDRLGRALEDIGSEKAPTRPYRQALDRLEELRKERRDLESRRAEYRHWIDERTRLAAAVSALEAEVTAARRTAVLARYRDSEQRLRALEDLSSETDRLRREMDSVGIDISFPAHLFDELNACAGARQALGRRLEELHSQEREVASRLAEATEARRLLEPYEPLNATGDGDAVIERFHAYLGLSVQRDSAQRTLARLEEDREVCEEEFRGYPEAIRESGKDWGQVALVAGEEERLAAQKIVDLSERLASARCALVAIRSGASRWRVLGIGMAIAGVLAVVCAPFFPAGTFRWVVTFAGMAAVGAAAVLLRRASRLRAAGRPAESESAALEGDIARLRDSGATAQERLRRTIAEAGFATLEEFLQAARRAEDVRRRITDLQTRAREVAEQRDKAHADCASVFAQIKETLGRVGLACAPGNLTAQMDQFRSSLKRFREIEQRYVELRNRRETVTRDIEELSAEAAQAQSRIAEILSEGRADSVESFGEACRRRQRLLELMDKTASREREFERLREGRTLAQWRATVADLASELDSIRPRANEWTGLASTSGDAAPLLPYLPSVPEAEAEAKRLTMELGTAREDLARSTERVLQAFHGHRSPAEIEEDLAVTEQTVSNLATNRRALELAFETVRALSREQQEVLAPQLNASVEQRFLRLCADRYEEVRIDPDFDIRLRETGTGEFRVSAALSRGTQDQIYFALRFGILELLSRSEEACPCLLDEPFAAYDRDRSEVAFRILAEEAQRRQLLLFTCREDVRDLALAHGACRIDLCA